MRKLDEEAILRRADELYAEAKFAKHEDWREYYALHPELTPRIKSDQVRCLLKALVEALNYDVRTDLGIAP